MSTKPKLLVIDDNQDFLKLVPRILDKDFVATTFNNPKPALKYITEGNHVDLVLCDVVMPMMSGIDFYHKVREHVADVPFIFLTGIEDPELDHLEAVTLRKPIPKKKLIETITEELNKAHPDPTSKVA